MTAQRTQRFVLRANDTTRVNVLANAQRFLAALPASKSWRVEVCEHHDARTLKQNATLYGVAEETLAEFCGLRGEAEMKALHRELCCLFFGRVDMPIGCRPKRTTTTDENGNRSPLNTKQMAEFFDFIQQQAAEIGCFIPDPDPLWRQRQRWADESADQTAA